MSIHPGFALVDSDNVAAWTWLFCCSGLRQMSLGGARNAGGFTHDELGLDLVLALGFGVIRWLHVGAEGSHRRACDFEARHLHCGQRRNRYSGDVDVVEADDGKI